MVSRGANISAGGVRFASVLGSERRHKELST